MLLLQKCRECVSLIILLKLFAHTTLQLIGLLKVTENFNCNFMNMKFGVDICAVVHVKQGRMVEPERIQLLDSINLRSLVITDSYNYTWAYHRLYE